MNKNMKPKYVQVLLRIDPVDLEKLRQIAKDSIAVSSGSMACHMRAAMRLYIENYEQTEWNKMLRNYHSDPASLKKVFGLDGEAEE